MRCVSAQCVFHNNAIISQQIQGKTHTLYHFSIGRARFTPVWWVDKFLLFLYGQKKQPRSAVLTLCVKIHCLCVVYGVKKIARIYKSATSWCGGVRLFITLAGKSVCFFRLGRRAQHTQSRLRGSLPLSHTSTHHTQSRERERSARFYVKVTPQSCYTRQNTQHTDKRSLFAQTSFFGRINPKMLYLIISCL